MSHYLKPDGKLYELSSHKHIGYVKTDGKVYNAMHKQLGYAKADGKVWNAMHKQLGYIKPDGKIYNVMHKPIENISNIEKKIKDSRHIKSYILLAVYNFLIKPIF